MRRLLKYVFALIIIVGTVFIWFKYLSNLPGEPDVSNPVLKDLAVRHVPEEAAKLLK